MVETSFNGQTPLALTTVEDWNKGSGGGVNGWRDVDAAVADFAWMKGVSAIMFPEAANGQRGLNVYGPEPGRNNVDGAWNSNFAPEMVSNYFFGAQGGKAITPTAGTAVQATPASFPSAANTLTAQPTGDEQIVFTIASSTDASGASIVINVAGSPVETIPITDSVSSVDGVYYSKGGYGTGGTVTFDLVGTSTGAGVTVTGISFNTTVITSADTVPTFAFEQHGGSDGAAEANSWFYTGAAFASVVTTFDIVGGGLVQVSPTVLSRFNTDDTVAADHGRQVKTTFSDEGKLYHRFAGWQATLSIDSVDLDCPLQSATLTVNSGNILTAGGSGDQEPCAVEVGPLEVLLEVALKPDDATEFDAWLDQTDANLVLTLTSPHFVNGATPYSASFRLPTAWRETFDETTADESALSTFGWRGVYDPVVDDILITTIVDRMPV
jgi:hypothetical protein